MSEGSVERRRGATDRHPIQGVTRLGRVGTQQRSPLLTVGVFGKSGVYASKGPRRTPGDLPGALGCRVRRKLAERGVIRADPRGGVSRGQSRPSTGGPKACTDGKEGPQEAGPKH